MAKKNRTKVHVVICMKEELQERLQNWIDENPGEEDIRFQVPIVVGQVIVLIIFYKIIDETE